MAVSFVVGPTAVELYGPGRSAGLPMDPHVQLLEGLSAAGDFVVFEISWWDWATTKCEGGWYERQLLGSESLARLSSVVLLRL